MADLSNLKISNTFARLLQVDPDTTQLQDGGGANPTIVTFNGTDLKYVDGNQQNNYILTSDANGVARWAANSGGGGSTDVYWDASSVDGTFIINSGVTNSANPNKVGIGTMIPNHELSVSGTVSASTEILVGDGEGLISAATIHAQTLSSATDLYLGSAAQTGSTIFGEEQIIIKGRANDNDFLTLKKDRIDFNLDGTQVASFISMSTGDTTNTGIFSFNTSSQDYDFKIVGDDGTPIFNVDGSGNRIRVRDHLTIGNNTAVSHANAVLWGLAVTGSSLFYGGENESDAIHASGVISASTKVLAGDGDGFISAATIDAPILSGISTYGDTIYSGSTNLADVLISLSADSDYWSGNTDGSISPSGLTTYIGIGTQTPAKTFHVQTEENTVAVFESTDATVALKISDSTDDAYIVGKNNMLYISDASGSPSSNAEFAFDYVNGKLGIKTTTPNVPLTVVGDISGTTNLYIDGDINGNRKFEPSSIDVGNKQGDIVYFPVEPPASTTAGSIYYYDGSTWLSTDASAVATSSGLTAVAVGTDSSEGMLIRGMVTLAASTGGVDGNVIYLSEAAGKAVTSPPASASAVVRTMGYVLDTSEKRIWFNPDNTWVELSS